MRALRIAAALLFVACAAPLAAQQDPRAARLAAANTFPVSELADRQAKFLAWLDIAGRSLSQDDALNAYESLYYLIGSAAQAQQRRTGDLFPRRDTLGLGKLFESAGSIGAVGAALVAHALRDPSARPAEPQAAPGGTLRIAFRAPEYTITSSRGWSIRVPYYMMIGTAQTSVPTNGLSTETVVLSTLFAADSSPRGRSQATILVVAAPAKDSADFVPFWVTQLGMSPADGLSGDKDGAAYRQYDARFRMHKEVVLARRGDVVVLFAYLGLAGTFQANREEFRATVASLAGAAP